MRALTLSGAMARTLSKYFIASVKLPRLPRAAPMLLRASTLSGSIVKTLSKYFIASVKLPRPPRAAPLLMRVSTLSDAMPNVSNDLIYPTYKKIEK
jgi:hypothetical protein